MDHQISHQGPTVFFKHLVDQAIERRGVESSEDSTFYMVQLLASFVRPKGKYRDLGHAPEHPLGVALLRAEHCPRGAQRFVLLRFTGDMALFLGGFFASSLPRRQVAPRYYAQLGQTAYRRAATTCVPQSNSPLFAELASKFQQFSGILEEVGQRCNLGDDRNLLRVYERWQASGNQLDAEILQRHGITPYPGSEQIH